MTKKKSFEEWQQIAISRNHVLSNPSNPEHCSKGSFDVQCNTCGAKFTALAKNYGAAPKTGCPTCKSINARARRIPQVKQPQTDTLDLIQTKQIGLKEEQPIISAGKIANYDQIVDDSSMKTYLEKENNEYTRYILQKLQNPKPQHAKSFNGEKTEIHHIIPKHAGGKNNFFNRILLTVSEHQMAHAIRYSVYKEFGDYNVSYMNKLTGTELVPVNEEYEKQLVEQRKRGSQTQKQKQVGIFAPGAAQRAGQISGQQPPTITKKLGSAKNRNEKTRNLLNVTGSKWTHLETGIVVIVKPSPTAEMRDIKDALAAALPLGHPDRLKLERSTGKAKTTQINHLSKLIKGVKGRGNKVYGFVFEPLTKE